LYFKTRGFIKGWAVGKFTGHEDDFAPPGLTISRKGLFEKSSIQNKTRCPPTENGNETPE